MDAGRTVSFLREELLLPNRLGEFSWNRGRRGETDAEAANEINPRGLAAGPLVTLDSSSWSSGITWSHHVITCFEEGTTQGGVT